MSGTRACLCVRACVRVCVCVCVCVKCPLQAGQAQAADHLYAHRVSFWEVVVGGRAVWPRQRAGPNHALTPERGEAGQHHLNRQVHALLDALEHGVAARVQRKVVHAL